MVNFISTHPNLALVIALAVFVLLLAWVIYLTYLVRTYFKDKRQIISEARKKGIDQILEEQFAQIKKLNLEVKELQAISEQLAQLATLSITKVGMIRYNPFGDVGGDQSFSIVLLNHQNDGLVLSSLHGREGTRVYSKPLENGKSKYHLSEEEEEAIKEAQSKS